MKNNEKMSQLAVQDTIPNLFIFSAPQVASMTKMLSYLVDSKILDEIDSKNDAAKLETTSSIFYLLGVMRYNVKLNNNVYELAVSSVELSVILNQLSKVYNITTLLSNELKKAVKASDDDFVQKCNLVLHCVNVINDTFIMSLATTREKLYDSQYEYQLGCDNAKYEKMLKEMFA